MNDDGSSVEAPSEPPIILVDIADRVAVVTLNRPHRRNALNRALYARIAEVMRELDADDAVDVIVLTGADPAFSAGVDLKELGGDLPSDAEADAVAPRQPGAGRTPWNGPIPPVAKPVIGAVNGPCVTGALELALACDFLVASERARFADTHARVGVMPGDGMTVRLPQAIGIRRAKEMSVTGNYVDATTALAWGLVNHVVPHDELIPFCRRLAADIVTNDQAGVQTMLDTYDRVCATTETEGWSIELAVSVGWEGAGYDAAEIARRRAGVIERGRAQQS
jgi:enoyl-CoA hydratase